MIAFLATVIGTIITNWGAAAIAILRGNIAALTTILFGHVNYRLWITSLFIALFIEILSSMLLITNLFRPGNYFINAADHIKCLLGQMIIIAAGYALEGGDGVG